MIYNKAFLKGNFDQVYTAFTQNIPEKLQTFKQQVLPGIDAFLEKMLQGYNSIEKTSIDMQVLEKFKGLQVNIVYTVDDFKVPDAPQKAIDADKQTLQENLAIEGFELTALDIDVNEGLLKLTYTIPV